MDGVVGFLVEHHAGYLVVGLVSFLDFDGFEVFATRFFLGIGGFLVAAEFFDFGDHHGDCFVVETVEFHSFFERFHAIGTTSDTMEAFGEHYFYRIGNDFQDVGDGHVFGDHFL